jgi:ribosomal protein L32
MAPLPKRKHSKARKGKRILERQAEKSFQALVICGNCGKRKLPHQMCKFCNSTDNKPAMSMVQQPQEEAPAVTK